MNRSRAISSHLRRLFQSSFIFYATLFTPDLIMSADFTHIEIYPKNVGVFTVDGKQQFVAFGVTGDGRKTNITDKVTWKSSNTELVKIDESGLAVIQDGITMGQVDISCSFPKIGALTPVIGSLLRPSYTVTAEVDSSADFGDISPTGDSSVKRGNSLFVNLIPDDSSYEVVAGNVGGTCPRGIITDNYSKYRTGTITEKCSVTIPFTSKPVITASIDSANNSGSMLPDNTVPVNTNAVQTFKLTPATGFEVSTVDIQKDSSCPTPVFSGIRNNTLKVGPVTDDCNVIAHFTPLPAVTITSSVDPSDNFGSISPAPTASVVKWSTASFTLTPAGSSYKATKVSGTCPPGSLTYNDPVPNSSTYVTGAITDNCSVIAHFTDDSVNITSALYGGNGNFSPKGTSTYPSGSQAVFTLTPEPGYTASLLSDTCGSGGFFSNNQTKYTTAALTSDCAIAFEFSPLYFSLSVSIVGDGLVYTGSIFDPDPDILCYELNPDNDPHGCTHIYPYGDSVTLHAQENIINNSVFLNWNGCNTENNQDCTVTMDGNKTVTATFSSE